MSPEERQELISGVKHTIFWDMTISAVFELLDEVLTPSLTKLDDTELAKVVMKYAPHLLEEDDGESTD
jgi:hypothetical protein